MAKSSKKITKDTKTPKVVNAPIKQKDMFLSTTKKVDHVKITGYTYSM